MSVSMAKVKELFRLHNIKPFPHREKHIETKSRNGYKKTIFEIILPNGDIQPTLNNNPYNLYWFQMQLQHRGNEIIKKDCVSIINLKGWKKMKTLSNLWQPPNNTQSKA